MGRRSKQRTVSASALSQMGVCERMVVFEHREGRRLTAAQKDALRRGVQAHRRFAAEQVPPARLGRCFIATPVFIDASETQHLRSLLARILRRMNTGWRLIHCTCTSVASATVGLMKRWPMLQRATRATLRPIGWLARRLMEARGDGRVV
jgi:hypothetical protein